MQLCLATSSDAYEICRVYNEYIPTAITFEYTLPSLQDFVERMQSVLAFYPWLVVKEQGHIVAYAYAHKAWERKAYQWNAELAIYIGSRHCRCGLGSLLYTKLLTLLTWQGINTALACVTVPNQASEALHRRFGFEQVALFKHAGYKNGAWHDVAWFSKSLLAYDTAPQEPKAFTELEQAQVEALLCLE